MSEQDYLLARISKGLPSALRKGPWNTPYKVTRMGANLEGRDAGRLIAAARKERHPYLMEQNLKSAGNRARSGQTYRERSRVALGKAFNPLKAKKVAQTAASQRAALNAHNARNTAALDAAWRGPKPTATSLESATRIARPAEKVKAPVRAPEPRRATPRWEGDNLARRHIPRSQGTFRGYGDL